MCSADPFIGFYDEDVKQWYFSCTETKVPTLIVKEIKRDGSNRVSFEWIVKDLLKLF